MSPECAPRIFASNSSVGLRRVEIAGIRGGCWINLIPAGGLLLAPEASSGCYCTHAIQISAAWAPRGRVDEE